MKNPFSWIYGKLLERHDRILEKKIRRQIEITLSHELKTPLTSILAYSEMLLENLSGQNKEYALLINKNSIELLRLIDNIIAMSILEFNPQIIYMTVINLSALIRESISEFQKTYIEKECLFKTSLEEGAAIYGNEKFFKKMIQELLINSYRYSKEGEKILIEMKLIKNDKGIEFAISDNGIGIKEKYLSRIYDKFFRIEEIEMAKTPGLGVGLSLVRKIVEFLNGSIQIKSQYKEGTTVSIHFPLNRPMPEKEILPNAEVSSPVYIEK